MNSFIFSSVSVVNLQRFLHFSLPFRYEGTVFFTLTQTSRFALPLSAKLNIQTVTNHDHIIRCYVFSRLCHIYIGAKIYYRCMCLVCYYRLQYFRLQVDIALYAVFNLICMKQMRSNSDMISVMNCNVICI